MSTQEDGVATKPKSKTRTVLIALGAILLLVLVGVVIWGAVSPDDEVVVGEAVQPPAAAQKEVGSWTVDPLGRKVWVAKNEAGDLLPQKPPTEQRIEWPTATDEITLPEGFQFQLIGNDVEAAFSTSDGPTGFTEDGVQTTGYALTGQGAALMAADTLTRVAGGPGWGVLTVDGRSLEPVTAEQRAKALAEPDENSLSTRMEGTVVQYAPEYFRTQFCDIDVCVVEFMGGTLGSLSEGAIPEQAPQFPQRAVNRVELHNVSGKWKIANTSGGLRDAPSVEGWSKWQ